MISFADTVDLASAIETWTFTPVDSVGLADVATRLNLAPKFIDSIAQDPRHLEDLRRAEIMSRRPEIDLSGRSPRLADVAFSISSRSKLYLCPFTGEWRETHTCIGYEAYLGEHLDRYCLILQCCFAFYPGGDSAFVFLDRGEVVYFSQIISQSELVSRIRSLFDGLSRNLDLLRAHLDYRKAARPLAVVEMRVPHFGHFVWNGLSAWGQLLPHCAAEIDIFMSWQETNFVGRVFDIYPEVRDKPQFVLSDEADLARIMFQKKAFAVFAKDDRLTEALAQRVLTYAWTACPKVTRQSLEDLRERCGLIVLLALRIGNRSWLGQEDGFVKLAEALHSRFPSVGFIIDGLNRNTSQGWTHALMSLSDEVVLAKRVALRIDAFAPCLSMVGAAMAESLVASNQCDLFVAPAGSGLAKYKWIANKPGVVIANSTVLDLHNPRGAPIRVFEFGRENRLPSKFVPAHAVSDTMAEDRPGVSHANFDLDWRVVLETVESLLEDLNIAAGGRAGYRRDHPIL